MIGFSLLLAPLLVCEQVVQSPKAVFELRFEIGHFACPRRSFLAAHGFLPCLLFSSGLPLSHVAQAVLAI